MRMLKDDACWAPACCRYTLRAPHLEGVLGARLRQHQRRSWSWDGGGDGDPMVGIKGRGEILNKVRRQDKLRWRVVLRVIAIVYMIMHYSVTTRPVHMIKLKLLFTE